MKFRDMCRYRQIANDGITHSISKESCIFLNSTGNILFIVPRPQTFGISKCGIWSYVTSCRSKTMQLHIQHLVTQNDFWNGGSSDFTNSKLLAHISPSILGFMWKCSFFEIFG